MKNSKLIQVLSSLSTKESRELELFLHSPYFNKRLDVQQLYAYLHNLIKEQQAIPKKQNIHIALFPNQPYKIVNFDLLMSYLYRLVGQFIQQKEMEAATSDWQLQLARGFRKRGLTTAFNQSISQVQKQLEQQPERNADYFQRLYDLQWEQSKILTSENPSQEANMEALTQSIDIAYLSTKLRHACLATTHRSIYQTDQIPGESFT